MEFPNDPSDPCISRCYNFHIDEPEIEMVEMEEFSPFCWRVLICGGYAVWFCDDFIEALWISSFNKTGFIVMQYQYIFISMTYRVPGRNINGFPKKFPCLRQLHTFWCSSWSICTTLKSWFTDMNRPSQVDSVVISKLNGHLWTKKTRKQGALVQNWKGISLPCSFVQLFVPN